MVGTVLGPGTIFLMIVGSFNVAFGMDNWTSFWVNLVPIIGFIIICMTTKAKFQVAFTPISIEKVLCNKCSTGHGGSTPQYVLRNRHDGRARRHNITAHARRPGISVRHFLAHDSLFVHNSRHSSPSRVLVFAHRRHLLPDGPIDVPSAHCLLRLQPEQRFVGHA